MEMGRGDPMPKLREADALLQSHSESSFAS